MQTLFLPFIHFAALVGFLFYKGKEPFGQFVRSRHQDILIGLNKSKDQAAEATRRKMEIESKLSGLEQEKLKIISEWKEREAAQIKAIRESTQRVLAQLKSDADLTRRSLEEGFRAETLRNISLLVIAKAEQKLKASMTPEFQKKVNDGFVKELAGA